MISASKTTFSHFNLNILRPKVAKKFKNVHKKLCELPPSDVARNAVWGVQYGIFALKSPPKLDFCE
jgi:hypothetical protein